LITSEEEEQDETKAVVAKSFKYWINDLPESVVDGQYKANCHGNTVRGGSRKSLFSKIVVDDRRGFAAPHMFSFYPWSLSQMKLNGWKA
ncbi:hypothetical protein Tsubulata_047314, partial [Turnera subulata]